MKVFSARALALICALIFSAGALAQSGGAATQAAAFNEQQLRQFAAAYTAIVELSQEYAPKIKAAADMQQVEALNREAQGKMLAAVNATGLSKEEYQQIANQLKTDEALVDKINQLLQQLQQ